MKNKKVLLIAGLSLILVLIFGGLFFVANSKKAPVEDEIEAQAVIPSMKPEEIGLVLSWKEEGKIVLLEIEKTEDLKAVEYELLYKTQDVTQRAFNMIKMEKGEAISEEIPLGTCSSGVCRYDKDISDIEVILKVTKTDGKIYQVQESLEL